MPTKASTAKKTAPKKAAKKAVVKKSTAPRASKKKVLVYADNARSFWVQDGQILNSLLALQAALQEMDKAVFAHHVSKSKNDFAEWVDAVLCDAECAADLRKAKTLKSAHVAITKHLKSYSI